MKLRTLATQEVKIVHLSTLFLNEIFSYFLVMRYKTILFSYKTDFKDFWKTQFFGSLLLFQCLKVPKHWKILRDK